MTKVTEWAYEFIVGFSIADKAIGKAFIRAMAPFPNDPDSEESALGAIRLKVLGDVTDTVVAYATVCPCKADFYDFFQAVKEAAPFSDPRYDFAKSRGFTLAQFSTLKAAVLFINIRQQRDLVTNEYIERPVTVEQYLANQGYEQIAEI